MSEEEGLVCNARMRPWLRARNEANRLVILFQPRCKLWTCPACGELNKRLWGMKTEHGARQLVATGREIQFLTLTSHEKLTPAQTMSVWGDAWKKLRTRAVRAVGRKMEYLMIPEQHKSGRLHMHAVETANLTTRWWKDNARECGLGYMAEEEEVEGIGGAVFYVTKYVTKTMEDTLWPTRWRRVRASQGWPKMPEMEQPEDWTFDVVPQTRTPTREKEMLESAGYRVVIADHASAWVAVGAEDGVID